MSVEDELSADLTTEATIENDQLVLTTKLKLKASGQLFPFETVEDNVSISLSDLKQALENLDKGQ